MSDEQGVGRCPKRAEGFGHVWVSWRVDPRRSCEFCGAPGRDNRTLGETGGFFGRATMARYDMSGPLAAPMQNGLGKPEIAYPKGVPPAVAAKVAEIIADKKRRDAEAVASGTARPGQIAGAPKGKR